MNGLMPPTTTATELQRNYKKVVEIVKKVKGPVTVLSNNKPEIVVMDYKVFTDFSRDLIKKKAIRAKSLDDFYGSWSKEEAKEFDKVTEDAFEQVNSESWK